MANTCQGGLSVRTQTNASWPCHFILQETKPHPTETRRENPGKNRDSSWVCDQLRIRKPRSRLRKGASGQNAPPSRRAGHLQRARGSAGREGRSQGRRVLGFEKDQKESRTGLVRGLSTEKCKARSGAPARLVSMDEAAIIQPGRFRKDRQTFKTLACRCRTRSLSVGVGEKAKLPFLGKRLDKEQESRKPEV